MIPREPHDYSHRDEYYRLLPEGEFNLDQRPLPAGSAERGFAGGHDMNRAFPTGFDPVQGGPHPMYLAETAHVAKAITARNNICTMLTHHTSGRLLIMPAGRRMLPTDRRLYEDLNFFGEKTTGYKIVGRRQTEPGPTTKDWAFYHRGILVRRTKNVGGCYRDLNVYLF
eukprot:SAG31_NODE_7334_length_1716_cov_1.614100_1_plen_169_part_00